MGSLTAPGIVNIGANVVGGTAGRVLFVGTGPVLADTAKITLPQPDVAGQGPAITAGAATTAVSPLALTQTWNAAGITFPGLTLTITDTASAAGSLALQILGGAGGATNLLSLSKGGLLTTGDQIRSGGFIYTPDATGFGWLNRSTLTSSADGFIRLANAGATGFSILQLFSDTGISRLASGIVSIGSGANGAFDGRQKLTSTITAAVAVGALNGAPTVGEVQTVNDALAVAAKGAAVAAGGAAVCQVMWNGAAWVGV